MKFAVASLVMLSFVAIAVFGFTAMHPGENNGFVGCIDAETSGIACIFSTFHAAAFKNFSTAIFLFFGFLFFTMVLYWMRSRRNAETKTRPFSFWKKIFESFTSPLEQKITRWLALREHSPAI